MLRTCTLSAVRSVRAFATATAKARTTVAKARTKARKPFLADAIAKAAIGKDAEVAASFVAAFAGVVHGKHVRTSDVSTLPEIVNVSISRDMKHDIALRYRVGDAESALMEVVPQLYSRSLVEIQQQSVKYLPARSLAHASGHYLAAIDDEAKAVKERRMAAEAEAAKGDGNAGQPRLKSNSKMTYVSDVYNAYLSVEPVHLLMLSDFCYAHDTAANVWRTNTSTTARASGDYGWVSPLFSTFCLTTGAKSSRLVPGVKDPGPSTFASTLQDRLSITIVHLPLVPMDLEDDDAWNKVVTLPEHQQALKSVELRQWLHYLAHTTITDDKVDMPAELRAHPIFRKSAEMAETLLGSPSLFFSAKEVADYQAAAAEERENAVAEERAAAAEEREKAVAEAQKKERAAAAEEQKNQRAAAAEEQKNQRAAAAVALGKAVAEERAAAAVALEKERVAAAERVAALMSELERLKPGPGGS
jgi:hypothetical protein